MEIIGSERVSSLVFGKNVTEYAQRNANSNTVMHYC